MSWSAVAARLRGLFERQRVEGELDDEVRFHLEMQIEDNLKAGMAPAEARYAALRGFGAIQPMKETYRDRSAFNLIETIAQDVRYALRALYRSPGFAATSVTTLALAIGATTAMLSVVNGVLLRPLSYPSPEQLAMLWTEIPSQGVREGRSAFLNVEQWRSQSKTFADMAILDPASVTLTGAADAQQISVARVSPNYFSILGVRPMHGRTFSAREAEERRRLAVISHSLWQMRFGASRDALGASIQLDGRSSQIIGILPPGVLAESSVWEPHTLSPDWEALRSARGPGPWFVIGRLRSGVTVGQAQAEMNAIAQALDEQLPAGERKRGISVVPMSHHIVGARPRTALWSLTAAVFCVLLIATANVTGLSLARSVGRSREIAIRAALGASPARIVRQLLAESVTLAVVSGVFGSLLALAGVSLIRALGSIGVARLEEVSLDMRVLGWALAISLTTGILVGLAPAMMMMRRNLGPSGEEGGRGAAGGVATRGIRRALVVAEFALAIVLLVGAGLLIRSWSRVMDVDPGFKPERVLSMQLSTSTFAASVQRVTFYDSVLEQIHTVPGVQTAAIIGDLFFGGNAERIVTLEGDARATSERLRFRRDEVSNRFFEAVGTPLLTGRNFSREDGPGAAPVAIVNDAMARRLWPGRDPVGRRFKIGPPAAAGQWFTVVGVVSDMRRQGLENEPIPQMFEPLAQNPSRLATLVVRTSVDDPLEIAPAVQAAVRRVDKHAPVYAVNTLDRRLGTYLAPRRFQTTLLTGFAIFALLMAAVGIYSLIQYSVAGRTREIGIRMAVGAQARDIFFMIVREGLTLSLIGVAIGLAGAVWLGQAGSSLLFGVTATDPLTFSIVPLLLTTVALAACYFPARRAMNVAPSVALRLQ